jgi:hypothetical protein
MSRLQRFALVSRVLAGFDEGRLGELLERAPVRGAGIGGASALIEVAGVPVFAKRIALTDVERRPGNVRSTANLFGMPAFCQYGVGGPGFGVWREVAAAEVASGWVRAGQAGSFPLLYHWRVLPGVPPPAGEHADVEAVVRFWGGSPAVRDRLEAVARASASVVLFQEFVPSNLDEWLAAQLGAGPEAVVAACAMVESALLGAVAFMNGRGLMHFDTHFANVLCDGRDLYVTDFGLATSASFDLSAEERVFLARNRSHDAGYAVKVLVNWMVSRVCGVTGGPAQRNAYVREVAAGADPAGVAPSVAGMLRRYAPVAVVMNDLYWDLFGVDRAAPYPAAAVERALAAARVGGWWKRGAAGCR